MDSYKIKASADNIDLATVVAEPEGKAKGLVLIVHGMCEHKGRYLGFMEYLAANGYIAVCYDHRGHGDSARTEQELGHMGTGGWKAMVEDIKVVADWAKAKYPGLKFTLFGHSMGSMAVRSFTKRYDDRIDTLFVCGSPAYNPAVGMGKLLAAGFGIIKGWYHRPRLLNKMTFGTYNKAFRSEGYANAWICSDKDIQEKYKNDRYCRYIFTANGFYNLSGLMMDCYSAKGWKMAHPDLPIYFIAGAEDPCHIDDAHQSASVQLMKKAGYSHVDSMMFPGMRHEILNEKGKDQVYEYILNRL